MNKADTQKEFQLENKLIEEGPEATAGAPLEISADPKNPETPSVVSAKPVKEDLEGTDFKKASGAPEQLAQLKAELDKYKDIALRSVADLDNYRKRMAREKDDAIRYANANFLERLIPILDNFELGLQAAKAGGGQSAILDGMKMVFKQLQDFLASCGVETIEATGELLNDLRTSGGLVVFAINAGGQPVGFPVPLVGFEQAYAGTPVDNKQYGEARRALMQQIAQRQHELIEEQKKQQQADDE